LHVSVSHRLDAVDLARLWAIRDRKAALARGLLACVRRDRGAINDKVTSITMSREFGLRALVAFVLAIVIRSAWDPVLALVNLVHCG
jgi:hypothetical protein